jgi:hypothetical protein
LLPNAAPITAAIAICTVIGGLYVGSTHPTINDATHAMSTTTVIVFVSHLSTPKLPDSVVDQRHQQAQGQADDVENNQDDPFRKVQPAQGTKKDRDQNHRKKRHQ